MDPANDRLARRSRGVRWLSQVVRIGRLPPPGVCLLVEVLLFSALAIAATFPLILRTTTEIPLGAERWPSVPLLNVWTLWWNVDRLEHGFAGYWDAPIFFPTRGVFAFSEPQPVTGWLAWALARLLGGPIPVYNAVLLIALTLNGWTTCRFLTAQGILWPLAVAGGSMMSLLPMVHWQIGVLQTVSLWCVMGTLHALWNWRLRPDGWRATQWGAAFAGTYLVCCYHGVLLGLLLLVAAPCWIVWQWDRGRVLGWIAWAGAVATVLVAPVVTAQLASARAHPVEFPPDMFARLSVVPADYWTTPGPQLLPLPALPRADEATVWHLSPGTLKWLLAICGLMLGVREPRFRRLALFLALILGAAMVLAMGPRLEIRGWTPQAWLVEYLPGYGRIRNLFRFAFFVQLAAVLLAAVGLQLLLVATRALRGRLWRRGAAGLVVAVGILAVVEAWPPRPELYAPPAPEQHHLWTQWLADDTQRDARVLFWPLAAGRDVWDFVATAEWMYLQTAHGRPMVNGYSAVIPADYLRLEEAMTTFPDQESVAFLRETGVTHCLVDSAGRAEPIRREQMSAAGLEWLFEDPRAGLDVWRISAVVLAPPGTLDAVPAP